MAKLRHLAIAVPDPHATAEFYMKTFGMERAGYTWSAAGENIAGGNTTAAATMDQWMNSPGHCRNIMNGDYVNLGVGHVAEGALWTQVFGAPR